MAYSYSQTNSFDLTHLNLTNIPQMSPVNLTEVPAIEQSSLLPQVAQKRTPLSIELPSTLPERALNLVEKPTSQQLKPIGMGQTPASADSAAATDYTIASMQTNKDFAIWRKIHSKDSTSNNPADIQADWESYIANAAFAKIGSAALTAVGSIGDALSARRYRKDVEKTKSQYETQKKIIDANINNTEAGLLENLRENMANLDVMTAAKNVDVSSQAVVGDKAKGAMDLGSDVAAMRTQGSLQKAALDLEYAMNVRKARQAESDSYVKTALSIGGAALSLL